jgi:uncharacterized protein (TIGR03435 family)
VCSLLRALIPEIEELRIVLMTKRVVRNSGKFLLLVGVWVGLDSPALVAQVSAGPDVALASDKNAATVKMPAFEVVSIRPSKPGTPIRMVFLPDEYRSINLPLIRVILWAYFPPEFWSRDRLSGAPAWVMNDGYDIEAKLEDATAEEWKNLPTWQRLESAKPMLQALLAERFKLVVHRVPAEVQGYALVVRKHGAKLKEAKPDETRPPNALPLAGGGMMVPFFSGQSPEVTFFETSMASLADHLSRSLVLPFQDQTGLTGKYDFVLPKRDTGPPDSGQEGGASAPVLDDRWNYWDLDAIGLKLKPVKVPTTTLVIDHIERPSEN